MRSEKWSRNEVCPSSQLRADLVSSYALCGFSNLGAVGVQLGAYAALAPSRLGDCAQVAPRALVAGSVACFMTACVAGE